MPLSLDIPGRPTLTKRNSASNNVDDSPTTATNDRPPALLAIKTAGLNESFARRSPDTLSPTTANNLSPNSLLGPPQTLARRASFASDNSDGMIDLTQMLSTLPFFAGAANSQTFSEEIASAMKIRYFKPGDQVIKYGDVAKCMYLVIRGELSIMSEDNEVEFATLMAGQFGMK
jgi:hypothetical protein